LLIVIREDHTRDAKDTVRVEAVRIVCRIWATHGLHRPTVAVDDVFA